jgi:hypothetical protein
LVGALSRRENDRGASRSVWFHARDPRADALTDWSSPVTRRLKYVRSVATARDEEITQVRKHFVDAGAIV